MYQKDVKLSIEKYASFLLIDRPLAELTRANIKEFLTMIGIVWRAQTASKLISEAED